MPSAPLVGTSARTCEASLRRLGTEWIDLYQVHMWDKHTPIEETLSTLDDLVHEGKVRYIGASNFAGWHLAKALGVSALHNWEPFVCLQPEYSLITRDIERELLPLCESEGLAVIPWSPLGGGVLTGKYTRDAEFPAGTRGADTENPITFTYRLDDRAWTVVDAVKDAASKTGKSPAQIALNWVLNRRGVTAPIIGARNLVPTRGQPRRNGVAARRRHRQGLVVGECVPTGLPLRVPAIRRLSHPPPNLQQ